MCVCVYTLVRHYGILREEIDLVAAAAAVAVAVAVAGRCSIQRCRTRIDGHFLLLTEDDALVRPIELGHGERAMEVAVQFAVLLPGGLFGFLFLVVPHDAR